MNVAKYAIIAAALAVAAPAFAKGPKLPYTHKGVTSEDIVKSKDVRWLTVEDIRDSLKNTPPITVSFDIDDTVLVSSQCFYYGRNKWSPGKFDYLHNQDFWDYVADGCDLSSIPKASAAKLIEMHQARGDQVVFITGRTPASPKTPHTSFPSNPASAKSHPREGGNRLSTSPPSRGSGA